MFGRSPFPVIILLQVPGDNSFFSKTDNKATKQSFIKTWWLAATAGKKLPTSQGAHSGCIECGVDKTSAESPTRPGLLLCS